MCDIPPQQVAERQQALAMGHRPGCSSGTKRQRAQPVLREHGAVHLYGLSACSAAGCLEPAPIIGGGDAELAGKGAAEGIDISEAAGGGDLFGPLAGFQQVTRLVNAGFFYPGGNGEPDLAAEKPG